MDFSKNYFYAYQLIAAKEDTNPSRMEDLKAMKVGIQSGATGEEAVLKLQGKISRNISKYDSGALALEALEAGKMNAVVADNGLIQHHIRRHPNAELTKIYDPSFMPKSYGITIKKSNTELIKIIDTGLAGIKADGKHQAIYSKYFGEDISLAK